MLIHRVMSELMLTSRLVPSLLCTSYSRRLFCPIYGPQLVGVSLFWRGLNFCMLYLWGCPSACASTSSTVCLDQRWSLSRASFCMLGHEALPSCGMKVKMKLLASSSNQSFLFLDCSPTSILWCWICSGYGCIEFYSAGRQLYSAGGQLY